MLTKTNHSRLGSLAAVVGLLLVACATPATWADVFNIYVSDDVTGDVYAIPSNFGGAIVGGGQVFASGYGTSLYAIEGSGTTLYMAQTGGQIFTKNAASAPGGTGTPFVNLAATTFDITIADSGNLQAVGTASTTYVVSPSAVVQTYTHATGSVTAGIGFVPGTPNNDLYISEGSHIQHLIGSGTGYTDATPAGLAADTFTTPQFIQQIILATDGNLYTSDFETGSGKNIYRINPNTGAESLLLPLTGPTNNLVIGATTYTNVNPLGIEEGPDGRLYFTDYHGGNLFSINLDGTDPELVATGLGTNGPVGIAFTTPEPASMGLLAVGGLLVLRRRRA